MCVCVCVCVKLFFFITRVYVSVGLFVYCFIILERKDELHNSWAEVDFAWNKNKK